jgi:hypothetical protein
MFTRKNGELVGEKTELLEKVDGKVEEITAIPFTRVELRVLFNSLDSKGETTKDKDSEIISEKMVNPNFTYEEANDIPLDLTNNFINTILSMSGVKIENKTKKEMLQKTEDEFSKNSKEPSS